MDSYNFPHIPTKELKFTNIERYCMIGIMMECKSLISNEFHSYPET
jgi:hypothetical protein